MKFANKTKKIRRNADHYKHFTLKEREMIKHYLDIGINKTKIAVLLNRNKFSISRELKRNKY